jgi:hypothetical protein
VRDRPRTADTKVLCKCEGFDAAAARRNSAWLSGEADMASYIHIPAISAPPCTCLISSGRSCRSQCGATAGRHRICAGRGRQPIAGRAPPGTAPKAHRLVCSAQNLTPRAPFPLLRREQIMSDSCTSSGAQTAPRDARSRNPSAKGWQLPGKSRAKRCADADSRDGLLEDFEKPPASVRSARRTRDAAVHETQNHEPLINKNAGRALWACPTRI